MKPEFIRSYAARRARTDEKRAQILRFLQEEVFTTAELIQSLLGLKTKAPAYTTLRAMERDGLLRSAPAPDRPQLLLWGMTPHGCAMSSEPEEEPNESAVFHPSRVSGVQLQHHIELQQLHIHGRWQSWTAGRSLKLGKGAKIPDAVAVTASGLTVAIELERTVKSAKRYQEIIVSYLANRRQYGWEEIRYYCPDEAIRSRVEARIRGIKHIEIRGQVATPDQVTASLRRFNVRLYGDFA